MFGPDVDRVLAQYADVGPARLATVLADAQWSCPAYRSNRLLASRMPTYAFEVRPVATPASGPAGDSSDGPAGTT